MSALDRKQSMTVRQGGFTLIELTVVLLVLIGLAGLAIPFVSGYVDKTSTATGGITNGSAFSALTLYQTNNGGYPNNLDLLADAAGALDPTLDDNMALGKAQPMNYKVATLTAAQITNVANSLSAAGINTVVPSPHVGVTYTTNADGTYKTSIDPVSVTFDPAFANTAPINVSAAAGFVTTWDGMFKDICSTTTTPACASMMMGPYTGQTVANLLGYSLNTGHYIILLGINQRNSAIGKTLAQAPVVVPNGQSTQPHLVYSRYLAAFDVDAANGTAPAKLVGVVYGNAQMRLESVGTSIQDYYSGLTKQAM